MRHFKGDYADDGKAIRQAAREAVGNRCIRCGHPFESGKHGKGEWSPCDEQCSHKGPVRIMGKRDQAPIHRAETIFAMHATAGEWFESGFRVEAQWRILTVHHFDGDKSNDVWWNHLALCQRCHLQIQNKVDPGIPYFFEHSDWLKPYVAGFYAKKYEGLDLSREQVMARLDELLKHEFKA